MQAVVDEVGCIRHEHEFSVEIGLQSALQWLVEIVVVLRFAFVFQIWEIPSDLRLRHAGCIIQPSRFRNRDETVHAFAYDIPVFDLAQFSQYFKPQYIRMGVRMVVGQSVFIVMPESN